jgi:hypothetical protein
MIQVEKILKYKARNNKKSGYEAKNYNHIEKKYICKKGAWSLRNVVT